MVPHAELQQDIQRIVSVFMDRIAQAGEPVGDETERSLKETLEQQALLYNASALDIATGPYPELNMLDMLVFTHLCRDALQKHWVPNVFGAQGEAMVAAFTTSEHEAWDAAAKVFDAQEQADVRDLITTWEREHPQQFRVEGVRFQEFSEHAGSASDARVQKTRGLLGQVRSATRSADQALLVSERALFLVHRMPFLIRAHARLGVQQSLSDAFSRLDEVDALIRRCAVYALLVGVGWTLVFWIGYAIVKR